MFKTVKNKATNVSEITNNEFKITKPTFTTSTLCLIF
jgi:hypothetical protein